MRRSTSSVAKCTYLQASTGLMAYTQLIANRLLGFHAPALRGLRPAGHEGFEHCRALQSALPLRARATRHRDARVGMMMITIHGVNSRT